MYVYPPRLRETREYANIYFFTLCSTYLRFVLFLFVFFFFLLKISNELEKGAA